MGAIAEQNSRTAAAWPRRPSEWLRLILVLGSVCVAIGLALTGEQHSSLTDLEAAIDAGRVAAVSVDGEGLGPNGSGYTQQTVHWRDGWWGRRTTVRVSSPGAGVSGSAPVDGEITDASDVESYLRRHSSRLVVRPAEERLSSATVLGWEGPAVIGGGCVVIGLFTFLLLIGGPEPWRATRWAWFWLCLSPIGGVAFLLLGGPLPFVPAPRRGARRLTGGWAFLLHLVVPFA